MNIKITSKEAVSYCDHLSNHNTRFYTMAYDVACHRHFFPFFFFFVPLWCHQLKKHMFLCRMVFSFKQKMNGFYVDICVTVTMVGISVQTNCHCRFQGEHLGKPVDEFSFFSIITCRGHFSSMKTIQ